MTEPTLLTIILNYRTADMTLKSAEAALTAMEGISGALVIVDNDSGDGSFERLQAAAQNRGWVENDHVRVLQAGRNGGFGAGNNVGIQAGLPDGTDPDLYYILNSDAFPDRQAIRRLISELDDHPSAGLVGSYICGEVGDPHLTAFRFPSILGELEGAARFGPVSRLLRNFIVPLPIPAKTRRVDWLAGASMMIRRSVLDQIGSFDEQFFLYFEETDLCLRAKRAGWETRYVRDSKVVHIGSVSTGMKTWRRMPEYWFDSRLHYFNKNHGKTYAAAATFALVLGGLILRVRKLVQRKSGGDPPYFLRDLVRHSIRNAFRSAPKILHLPQAKARLGPRLKNSNLQPVDRRNP